MKFEGLLDAFHQNGGKSIKTEILETEPLIIQATVEGEKGTFQGIGDANENNVNKLIARHKIRMAETRAIARALRWYNNIGMCSADELGGDDNVSQETKVTDAKKGYGGDDDRPWLSEMQLNEMLKFIDEGQGKLVRDKMKNYRMKRDYRQQLESMFKNKAQESLPDEIDFDDIQL